MDEPKQPKTSEDLREMLFERFESLRDGKITPQVAQASVKIAQTILNSVDVEIQFYKNVVRQGEVKDAPKTRLQLSAK